MHIDETKADNAVKFINSLKHTKSPFYGQPFNLIEWEEKIIRDIFGTLNDDNTRQYRTAFIEIAKKNGKSELGAAVALLMLAADDEMGAEVYSAAMNRDQASMVFDVAAGMTYQSPVLSKHLKVIDSRKRIVFYDTSSYYQVLSADVPSKHGNNPHGVIFDELHAQKTRQLWDVLTFDASIARKQPLLFIITTAGSDRNSICYEQYDYAKKVAKGIIDDPTFYSAIFELDENDDWNDEENWKKANPSMGVTFSLSDVRKSYKKAKEIPANENLFKRFRLNQWTSTETRWMQIEKWDESNQVVIDGKTINIDVDPDKLKGKVCYAGLDLSSTTDISAFVLMFPINETDEKEDIITVYKVIPLFFIPADNIENRKKSNNLIYDNLVKWVQQGFIIATPGNVIDYKYIEDTIYQYAKEFEIEEIAYDPWNATMLTQRLAENGMTMVEVRQGFASLSAPTKQLETLILQKKIHHGGNPVLRWMFDNVMVIQDQQGNLKPNKEKSHEKIDGVLALIMAISRAMVNENRPAARGAILI